MKKNLIKLKITSRDTNLLVSQLLKFLDYYEKTFQKYL